MKALRLNSGENVPPVTPGSSAKFGAVTLRTVPPVQEFSPGAPLLLASPAVDRRTPPGSARVCAHPGAEKAGASMRPARCSSDQSPPSFAAPVRSVLAAASAPVSSEIRETSDRPASPAARLQP